MKKDNNNFYIYTYKHLKTAIKNGKGPISVITSDQTCFGLSYDFILALQILKSLIVFYF